MPRPSSLTPEILEDVRRLAATGMSKAKMRDELGIARGTWMGWQRERPEFLAALNVPPDEDVTCVRPMTAETVADLALAPQFEEPKVSEPSAEQPDPLPQIEEKPEPEEQATSSETQELIIEPAPTPATKPHPEALAKGMIDYAAEHYPNWTPLDFHQITNAFAYGQRMGRYWSEICNKQAEFSDQYARTREEPPEGDRAFAEEILTMIAERYPDLGEKDWRRVSQVLHVARTRGIKWVGLTAER